MFRYSLFALAVCLTTAPATSQTVDRPGEPLEFEKAPATDPAILSEKANREPFGPPNGLPVYAGLPASTPARRMAAPRSMPPEGKTLDRAAKVNPNQTPVFPGQTRAPVTRTDTRIEERVVVRGLVHPWALAFLPDGKILVTEKSGALRVASQAGELLAPVIGVPPVLYMGDAGLLGVAVDPDFGSNRWVYLSFIGFRPTGNALMVVRGRLSADYAKLEGLEQLLTMPTYHNSNHYGGGIVIGRDRKLYIGTSERIADDTMLAAQNPGSPMGKILRINLDGSIPADNPFAEVIGAEPRIWTMGNRDPEGLANHPVSGKLWISDHGPQGGDEINVVEAGRNYGWPLVAYGTHYTGKPVNGERTGFPGTEQPKYYWDPAIAPAGIAFYDGDLIPEWKGNLFVAALAGRHLARLTLDGERVVGEERLLLKNNQRVRDVEMGPDGALWVVTDETEGRLIRIAPRGK